MAKDIKDRELAELLNDIDRKNREWAGLLDDEKTYNEKLGEYLAEPGRQLDLFADTWAARFAQTTRHKEAAAHPDGAAEYLRARGVEIWTPGDGLTERGATYSKNKIAGVRELLRGAGLTSAETSAILFDYEQAARGNYYYTAPPATMYEAVNRLKPIKCITFDIYFYDLIFNAYRRIIATLDSYAKAGEEGTFGNVVWLMDRSQWITIDDAAAAGWAVAFGYIDPAAFADTKEGAGIVGNFAAASLNSGAWWNFEKYYSFCTFALLAGRDELDRIPRPTTAKEDDQRARISTIEFLATWIHDTLNADKERILQHTIKDASALVSYPRGLSFLNVGYPLIMRPAENRQFEGEPLEKWIARQAEQKELQRPTAEMTLQVIKGVSVFCMDGRAKLPAPDADYYTIDTNLMELARACGMLRPSADELRLVFSSTNVLHNAEYSQILKGRRPAASPDWVPAILFAWGEGRKDLKIMIPRYYMSREQRGLLPARALPGYKKASRGKETTFVSIIINTDHKTEEDLLKQVWGYDYDRAAAPGVEGRKYKRYWNGHAAERRRKLGELFAKFQAEGVIITYTRRGSGSAAVWSWAKHTEKELEEWHARREKKKAKGGEK